LDNLDKELAHLSGNMGEDEMVVVESNPKEGIRQYFHDLPRELNRISSLCSWWSRGSGSFRTTTLRACISHAEPPENKKALEPVRRFRGLVSSEPPQCNKRSKPNNESL
jgi:hypothetical protein